MATTSVTLNQDAVVGEIEVAASPARVFQALTSESELGRWFGGPDCPAKFWEMEPRLGGRYGYAIQKGVHAVKGVTEFECQGEIVEFDPPRVVAYTWVANWHEEKTHRTLVRWELQPTAHGTRVKVTHSGLAELPVARKDYSSGWPGVLDKLKTFLEQASE